jgi:hypothetical protein
MTEKEKEELMRYLQEIEERLADIRANRTPVRSQKLYLATEKDKLNDLHTRFFVDRAGWDNDVVRKLEELETAVASLEENEMSEAASR